MKKRFDDVCATEGDDVIISFTVTDRNENLVTVTAAESTFRIALKGQSQSLLELNNASGITYNGAVVSVAFNTSDIESLNFYGAPDVVHFQGQLRVTLGGKSMVSAFGDIYIQRLIE